jgi:hypothetical protein
MLWEKINFTFSYQLALRVTIEILNEQIFNVTAEWISLIIQFQSRVVIECRLHRNSYQSTSWYSVWEILILNLTQVHGTDYGNKYIIWLEDIMSCRCVNGKCKELQFFLRKREDCSTPSGQRCNQPALGFLVRIEVKSCVTALSSGQIEKITGSCFLVRRISGKQLRGELLK